MRGPSGCRQAPALRGEVATQTGRVGPTRRWAPTGVDVPQMAAAGFSEDICDDNTLEAVRKDLEGRPRKTRVSLPAWASASDCAIHHWWGFRGLQGGFVKHQKETYIACLLASTGVCSQRWWFFVPNLLLGIGLRPQRRNCGGHSSPPRMFLGACPSLPGGLGKPRLLGQK